MDVQGAHGISLYELCGLFAALPEPPRSRGEIPGALLGLATQVTLQTEENASPFCSKIVALCASFRAQSAQASAIAVIGLFVVCT
jgi:hypothetical protein